MDDAIHREPMLRFGCNPFPSGGVVKETVKRDDDGQVPGESRHPLPIHHTFGSLFPVQMRNPVIHVCVALPRSQKLCAGIAGTSQPLVGQDAVGFLSPTCPVPCQSAVSLSLSLNV